MTSLMKLLILLALILSWVGTASWSSANPGAGESQVDEQKRKMWESLSDEEKEQLKIALREVWTDPAVLAAREDVREASDAYQAAIHEAVQRVNPDLASLVKKAQAFSEGIVKERVGNGPPGARGPMMMRRGVDYPMSPPGFLDKLTPEEQERFRSAEKKAKETEEVQAAMEALKNLQKQDEMQRRRRMDAHRKMRAAVLKAMVQIDPSLEEIQKRLEIPAQTRPKGPGKGAKGGNGKAGEPEGGGEG